MSHSQRLRTRALRRQYALRSDADRRVVSPFVTESADGGEAAAAPRPSTSGQGLLTPLVLPAELRAPAAAPDAPPPGTTLGQHYARCYGCGVAQPAGLRMTFTVGEDVTVVSEFVVTEDHEGAAGLAHGGLLSAALDETQATLLWVLRMPAVTARLETDFLAPVPVGSIVRIEARCLGLADRKIYTMAEGRLVAADLPERGVLAMRSAALFVTVPVEHFKAFGRHDLVDASMNRDSGEVEVNP
jgi:acyl-coenzyme A thioesterase PaaI-like protein